MSSIPEISPTEVKSRLENAQPLVLLDVREPHEWAIADIERPDPLRIPVGELMARMGELDPASHLVVFCRSGGRSAWAVERLLAAGYENAVNLEGGILAWRDRVDPSLEAY